MSAEAKLEGDRTKVVRNDRQIASLTATEAVDLLEDLLDLWGSGLDTDAVLDDVFHVDDVGELVDGLEAENMEARLFLKKLEGHD